MNLLFTVCARAGSKGVKNKNIREFLGYPLIYYTLSCIDLFKKKYNSEFSNIDVCISSDGGEIIKTAKDFMNDLYIIKRPDNLSQDTSSKALVIKHALNEVEKNLSKRYDYIIDLDVTSPIRTIDDVYNSLDIKIKRKDLDIVFSVVDSRRNPAFNMVEELSDGIVKKIIESDFTARQQVKKSYDMNASIYVYSRDILVNSEFSNIFDANCGMYKMRDTGILDIDCENDFELMSVIADYLFDKDEDLRLVKENI